MTKEEWKQVEEWWGTGLGHVSMEIDGYSISLHNYADKEKMTLSVIVYIDGMICGKYSNTDNEIGNRFWQRIKKSLYSPKELKTRAQLYGKRSKESKQRYFEMNSFLWRSFSAFKKHIISNNASIVFKSCGF